MGTKAFLQKGRGKPGLVLPANAVAKVNQANDRSALVRAANRAMEGHAAVAVKEKDAVPAAGNLGVGSRARLTVQAAMSSGSQAEVVQGGAGATLATMQPAPIEPDPTPDGPGLKCDAPAPEPAPQAEEPNAPVEPKTEPSLPLKVTADPNAPLTVVTGIGTALAERFAAYGYKTLEALAKAEAETINEIPGVRKRGRQWIDEARKRLGL
jgi:predicted flap endonuclease-1-like 5' DNA nuclease